MHDTYRGHKDVAEFTPEDGHEFVEIWQQSSTAERTFQVGVLDHDQIDRWLKKLIQTKDETCSFRLLIAKPVDSVAPNRRPCPLTLDALENVAKVFNIPLPFVNLMAAHTTIAMDFDTIHDLRLPAVADYKRNGVICILGPIALAASYNLATKVTTGVVLRLCRHQADNLAASLRGIPEVIQVAMLLPILLINVLSETRAHRVLGRKQAINSTEVELGVHWGVQADLRP